MSRSLFTAVALSALLMASTAMAGDTPNAHRGDTTPGGNPPTTTMAMPSVTPATTPGNSAPGATQPTDPTNNDAGKVGNSHR